MCLIYRHWRTKYCQEKINSVFAFFQSTAFLISITALTLCFEAFAQLCLGFSVGSESSLGVELVGHGGCSNHGLEAACALGHILLGVEENHVDLRHVEQPEGHWGAQTHRDGQSGCLDVHLQEAKTKHAEYKQFRPLFGSGLCRFFYMGSGLYSTSDICCVSL